MPIGQTDSLEIALENKLAAQERRETAKIAADTIQNAIDHEITSANTLGAPTHFSGLPTAPGGFTGVLTGNLVVSDQIREQLIASGWTPPSTIPTSCDGKEQKAFEQFARSKGLDMGQHPLHYLFLDTKTNAAREGWNAAIRYVGKVVGQKSNTGQGQTYTTN